MCGERYAGDCSHTSPEQKADLREWEQRLADLSRQLVDRWADEVDVDGHLMEWAAEMPPTVRILANTLKRRAAHDWKPDQIERRLDD